MSAPPIQLLKVEGSHSTQDRPGVIDLPGGTFLTSYHLCAHRLIIANALNLTHAASIPLPVSFHGSAPFAYSPSTRGTNLLLANGEKETPIYAATIRVPSSLAPTDLPREAWIHASSFAVKDQHYSVFQSRRQENQTSFLLLISHAKGTAEMIPLHGDAWGGHIVVWNKQTPYLLFAQSGSYLLVDPVFRTPDRHITQPFPFSLRHPGLPLLAESNGRTVAATFSSFLSERGETQFILQDLFAPEHQRDIQTVVFKLPTKPIGSEYLSGKHFTLPQIFFQGASLYEDESGVFHFIFPYQWEEELSTPSGERVWGLRQTMMLKSNDPTHLSMLKIPTRLARMLLGPAMIVCPSDRDRVNRAQVVEKNGKHYIFMVRDTGEAYLFRGSTGDLISYVDFTDSARSDVSTKLHEYERFVTAPWIIKKTVDGVARTFFSGITSNDMSAESAHRYYGELVLPN